MLEVLSINRELKDEMKEVENMLREIDRTQLPSMIWGLRKGPRRAVPKVVSSWPVI